MSKVGRQEKLQIFFSEETIDTLEEIADSLEIKRTDVVKIATKKYVDSYRASKNRDIYNIRK